MMFKMQINKEMLGEYYFRWYNLLLHENSDIEDEFLQAYERYSCLGAPTVSVRSSLLQQREINPNEDYSMTVYNLERLFLEPFEETDIKAFKRIMKRNGWDSLEEVYLKVKERHCRLFSVISCPRSGYIN